MEKVLMSACLLGEPVRYHGGDARISHPIVQRWRDEGRLVMLCPEIAGGLSTPRPAAEIVMAPGGRRVLTAGGLDVTDAFEAGARAALDACAEHGIRIAVLKDGSPSCGSQTIHDGTFGGRRIEGRGFTAGRLAAHGIAIFSEDQIDAAARYLGSLEGR
jgi:uncharacterized protein YbbK (DUF523 family)